MGNHSFKSKASKLTPCPNCGKYGLQGRYHKLYGNEIRCKECNSFWSGEESIKLKKLVDSNCIESRRKKKGDWIGMPYYKRSVL